MGLTKKQRELITSVETGILSEIKRSAIECLKEDTTQKNKYFCERYINIFKNKPSFLELPANMKDIATYEDLSLFNEKRYYIPDSELNILDKIIKMHKVVVKMKALGINYKNSTLLYGESGTGKTTFAKYLAKKMNMPLLYLNFSNLIDSSMGATSKNISKIFRYASENRCVLLLDEIDCISIKRFKATSGADSEMARITITLMQELDNLSSDTIVIAATNRLDIIDDALLRRFLQIHEVKKLNNDQLHILAKQYIDDVGINVMDDLVIDNQTNSRLIDDINYLIAKYVELNDIE